MSSTTQVAPTPVAPTAARPPARPRRRHLGRRVVVNLLGVLVFVVMVFPVYWMVATSFKTGQDILSYTPKWFPAPATLDNFGDAIHRDYFWSDVKNSLIVVGVVVALSLVLAFLAALALAKFRFYGRKAFIVIPLYILLSKAHQVDKLSGLIVTYLSFVLPFTIWTLRGFIIGVPRELEEAAMVDGSTRFGAFVRILLPLVAPGLVATSIFAFIQAWNEFIFAYVLLSSPEKQTLTVWLAGFITTRGTDWATLTALPVVVFFVLVHRRIAFGLTGGGVRG